jgi:hypothetical protein
MTDTLSLSGIMERDIWHAAQDTDFDTGFNLAKQMALAIVHQHQADQSQDMVEQVASAIRDTRKRIVARTNEWCVQEVTGNDLEFAKAAINAMGSAYLQNDHSIKVMGDAFDLVESDRIFARNEFLGTEKSEQFVAAIHAMGAEHATGNGKLREDALGSSAPASDQQSGYSVMGAPEDLAMQSGFADSGEPQVVPTSSDQREISVVDVIQEVIRDNPFHTVGSRGQAQLIEDAILPYLRQPEPVSVDLDLGARAIWDWEHDGRNSSVLSVEWSLLEHDYYDRAKACATAWRLKWK